MNTSNTPDSTTNEHELDKAVQHYAKPMNAERKKQLMSSLRQERAFFKPKEKSRKAVNRTSKQKGR